MREATPADAASCVNIYGPYVRDSAVTFETDVPTEQEMQQRIEAASRTHAWLVLEQDQKVLGHASGGPFRSRAAYRWSCEVSVYLQLGCRRSGAGRQLYEALLRRLSARGYRTALAGIALPNEASLGLHTALGFAAVGTYREVGWKLGRWHDVHWAQRLLTTSTDPPVEPV